VSQKTQQKPIATARAEGEQITYRYSEMRKIESLEYSYSLQMKYKVILALFFTWSVEYITLNFVLNMFKINVIMREK
jgi:hypothetical protein